MFFTRCLSLAAVSALVFAEANAQVISPAEFRVAEGPSYGAGPIGQSSASGWRYIQVHDDLAGPARTFQSLSVRRESTFGAPYNQFTARVTLILSNAATTAATIDSTFQNNHGANRLIVVNDRTVTFPSTIASGSPAPFAYTIPFDVPFRFNGVGSLCWELRVSNSSNMLTTYYFDAAYSSSTNPGLGVGTIGVGCRHSSRLQPMTAVGSSSMNWPAGTGTVYFDGSEMPENAMVTAALGFSRTNYAGLALPFELPGSYGSVSGACALHTSIQVTIGVVTSGSSARLTLPVPATPAMHGMHMYAQYLTYDPNSGHSIGLVGSNAVDYCWGQPFGAAPVSQVYATNSFATTGTVTANFGYVTRLQ